MSIGVRVAAVFFGVMFLTLPLVSEAIGMDADTRCVLSQCTMTPTPGRPYCPQVVCQDNTNGFSTVGFCETPTKCKGVSSGGTGLDSGLSQLGQVLSQLMQQLMKGQSGGGGDAGAMPPVSTTPTGCTAGYFQTSDVTQLSNPCAQYVAPALPVSFDTGSSTGVTACDTLSEALGMCGSNTNDNTNTNVNTTPLPAAPPTSFSPVFAGPSAAGLGLGVPTALTPQGGATGGDVLLSGNGATVFGFSQNIGGNVGVAGFYGADTFGAQPQSLAARLCQNRPWAGGFFSAVIPAAFFDGLCSLRGYQVGTPPPPPAPVVQLQQTPPAVKPPASPQPATTTQTVPASVKIWAVPASVPLNTRTSIFWTSQGVVNCTETSPDGNFSHNTLSGGAATVPLAGATTFTISCTDSAGDPVTDYTTVNIKI